MTRSIRTGRGRAKTAVCGLAMVGLLIWAQPAAPQEQPATGIAAIATPASISSFASQFVAPAGSKAETSPPLQISISTEGYTAVETETVTTPAGIRRITLDQAQQQAILANNPMLRLATLGVEAAKQHRLGVQADFFPKLSSTFANLHFNKFLGSVFEVYRPRTNTMATIAIPLFNKNETLVATTMIQPVTPLFKLHQVLTIARADEHIAKARAGQGPAQVASNVEQAYFGLLVAERQRKATAAGVKKIENNWRLASSSNRPSGLAMHETEWIEADKALILASSREKEARATLNALLGWPLETELELVVPPAFYENVSAAGAVEEALQNNLEIIEAEQTLVKARAASKLSKLDYVPDLAVVGGYAYQSLMPALPNDFSYIGLMANYNLFDFGKREHAVKERNAQVAMAETGLALVKAKVTAGVTKAYFELDRSRRLSDLARRMNSASYALEAGYDPDEAQAARAKVEAELLQAELDHRLAFSRLQELIGPGQRSWGK